MTVEMAAVSTKGLLLHFAKDERAYIASERFLSPETDSAISLVVRAGAAQIVPQTALSS
jgi:hypothetical protein